RNLKLWQNKTETCAQILDQALQLLGRYNQTFRPKAAKSSPCDSRRRGRRRRSTSVPPEIKWEKPGRGRYKCNIDASFSTQRNRVGLGICIREDEGRFVLAKTM
ncbi:cytochrome p450, partial [Trifolium pratense]